MHTPAELREILGFYKWIKVPKQPDNRDYDDLMKHHIAEAEFLINKCRELAGELLKYKATDKFRPHKFYSKPENKFKYAIQELKVDDDINMNYWATIFLDGGEPLVFDTKEEMDAMLETLLWG